MAHCGSPPHKSQIRIFLVAGWICGYEERTRSDGKRTYTERIPKEELVLRDYRFSEIACDPGDLGIKKLKNMDGETKLTSIAMLGDRLRVMTPSVRTSSGIRGKAPSTRFCTSTWAVFGSVPTLNVIASRIWPSLLHWADM